jgi:S1-C subfamily serine protease
MTKAQPVTGPDLPIAAGESGSSPSEEEVLDAYSRVVTTVAERLIASVASLRVTRRVRGGRRPEGSGSGFVITSDGFGLTSSHVVQGMDGGSATFADGSEHAFEIVGTDPLSDLAVLRIDRARRRANAPRRAAGRRDREPDGVRRLGHRGRR